MKPPAPPPVNIVALRATDRTPDGKNITLSLKTRYAFEREYLVPVECLYELIADLQKLNSGVVPETGQQRIAEQSSKDRNQISVTVPKKWTLTSGLPSHPVVVMVFDAQTETQAGYALSPAAAKEMATGLLKYAETIANYEANKPKLS